MTDVDAIIAGLSEAERAGMVGGPLLPVWFTLLQKGLIGSDGYTPLGLAVRDNLEADNG